MKFYLKGLDAYRAIAAIIVVVGHIELFKSNYHIPNLERIDFFRYTGGRTAVMLFFALSGYLITTLLVKEKNKTQTIDLKNFYVRRILRVWPLYFTIIILCLVVLQYRPSIPTLLLCVTIFPNVAHMLHLTWWASPQLWSLGVEEQFYVFWPFVISKSNKPLWVMTAVFIFFTFVLNHAGAALYRLLGNEAILNITSEMVYDLKFNCMAAGGIMAMLQNNKAKILTLFKLHSIIGYLFVVLPFLLWFSGFHFESYTDEFYAVLFSISIWNIAENEKVKLNIDVTILKFLGKISYGIYMYHWIILTLLMSRFTTYFSNNNFASNFVLYAAVLSLTIIVATLSYWFFEKHFLNLKDRFSKI